MSLEHEISLEKTRHMPLVLKSSYSCNTPSRGGFGGIFWGGSIDGLIKIDISMFKMSLEHEISL